MNTLLSQVRLNKTTLLGGVLVLFGLGASILLLNPLTPEASAGGAAGPGGTGSGGSGRGFYEAKHGYGWYEYDINGGGPSGGFRNGDSWASAQAACVGVGANKLIGFIYRNEYGDQKIYTWQSESNPARYQKGAPFITIADAKSRFDEMGGSPTYAWGSEIGWFCYDDRSEWSVSGTSTINVGTANQAASTAGTITAAPGNRLNWFHSLYNNGPDAMDKDVYYNIGKSGFSNGWNGELNPQGWVNGAARTTFLTQYASNGASYTTYDVTQNDVGSTLCQNIRWTDLAWNDGTDGAATAACAQVPYNYTLIPEITNITDGQMRESGAGNIAVQGRVSNNSVTKSHTNIEWQVTQVKYPKNTAIPNRTGGSGGATPCGYFNAAGVVCTPLSVGTKANGYGNNETEAYPATGNLGDEEVGTRLCYAMSVRRESSASGAWRHSQLYCFTVGKKPKVQVYGGDLIVGRGYNAAGTKITSGVTTSVSNKAGTHYGSWSEYAIIPSGRIMGMASASGYAVGTSSSTFCNTTVPLNLLSFSNATIPAAAAAPTCDPAAIGYYSLASSSQLNANEARFAPAAGAPSLTGAVNVTDLTSKTIYRGTGTINLSASAQIPVGKWVIINAPDADVRITSDIRYTNATLTSAKDIPQLIIIAKNIVINDSVENVDAWLFAKATGDTNGIINTCDSSVAEPSGLTSGVCDRQLTVNGPVISRQLLLYRTHGSGVGADSGIPAEIFNLRPDAYMWASTFSGVGTKARTVITTELPPRF